MKNENFSQLLYVKSRIIRDSIEDLTSSLQDKKSCVSFLFSLYSLLIQDSFLLLDRSLAKKIYIFANNIAFKFSGDKEVKSCRDCVVNKLARNLKLDNFNREEQVKDLLEKERSVRRIPDWFTMSNEEVLKMYELDFLNYSALCNGIENTSSIELFYFLTTVHKMCKDYFPFVKYDKWMSGFYSIVQDFEQQENDPLILEYLEMTKDRLQGRDEKFEKQLILKNKIIPFPDQKTVNS